MESVNHSSLLTYGRHTKKPTFLLIEVTSESKGMAMLRLEKWVVDKGVKL